MNEKVKTNNAILQLINLPIIKYIKNTPAARSQILVKIIKTIKEIFTKYKVINKRHKVNREEIITLNFYIKINIFIFNKNNS